MSYPQQPSGAPGEPVQPSPPPEFSPQPSPPPVTAPQSLRYPSGPAGLPPGRPAGIVIGGIGMFAIGLGYLVSAIVAGISAFVMGFHPGMLAMLATTVGQHLSTGSTTLAEGATDLRFLPGLMMLLLNLLVAVAAFAGGALVLMGKPIGRVLSLVVAGGAILMSCWSGVNSITMLALGGGPTWFSLILLLVDLGLFVAAVAVVAVLAPRRVEEWMRRSGQTTVAVPAMTAVPTQPVGYVPVQQAPAPQPAPQGQPPMDTRPPQAPPTA